jgi:hypothetical protein
VLLPEPLQQAVVGQQFQVTRDARLTLAKDLGQLGYRELARDQHCQQPQPTEISGGSKPSKQLMQA